MSHIPGIQCLAGSSRKILYILILFLLSGWCASAQTTDTLTGTGDSIVVDTAAITPDTTRIPGRDTSAPATPADTVTKSFTRKSSVKNIISGVVKDAETGEPIPFATVFFPGSAIGTTSDTDGNFILEFDAFPTDSLKVKVLGYDEYVTPVFKNLKEQSIIATLGSSAKQLNEVVIRAGEDPAIALIKKVASRKPYNNPSRFETYAYESYNKVQVDILNLTREEFRKLPLPYIRNFEFVYDNLDTLNGKPFLPFYFTETLSDYYYQSKPKRTKEFIKATKIMGINNPNFTRTMSRYLGNMFLIINPYDNYVMFFDKKYVSPINNNGPAFYKYTLLDTQIVEGYKVINVYFKPQRQGENCFEGLIGIVDSVFALQYITADVPKEANLNFVKNAKFYKTYSSIGDSLWFCVKESTTAELQAMADFPFLPSLRVTRTNSYDDIRLNEDTISQIVSSDKFKLDVVVADTANNVSDEFWAEARHDTLSKNERGIYEMVDTIQNSPSYNRLKIFMRLVATGVYRIGPIELGPYWNAYSYNSIEGNRFQFSMGTTRKFSNRLYLNGYLAYGTLDKRFKGRAEALYLLHKEFPRSFLFATYTRDIDRTVNYYDYVNFNNLLAIRKPDIPLKFMFTQNMRLEYMKEFYSGFSFMLSALHKDYDPYPPLPDFGIFNDAGGSGTTVLKQTEVNLLLRYAYKEQFLNGDFYRASLGSKYPIPELRIARGLKGALDGAYDYTRINFSISDNIRIPPLGSLYMNVFAGKYWGTLPYPLLQVHPGNESYIYNKLAFSMMNQYEFLSDQYVGVVLEHSIGGGIFNYIPGVKRLKFRQFWTAKGVIGSLNDENRALNFNKGFTFRTLENSPYIELGTGVENIFRLFRVDFVWRVAPKRLPSEAYDKYFGVFGSLKVSF